MHSLCGSMTLRSHRAAPQAYPTAGLVQTESNLYRIFRGSGGNNSSSASMNHTGKTLHGVPGMPGGIGIHSTRVHVTLTCCAKH